MPLKQKHNQPTLPLLTRYAVEDLVLIRVLNHKIFKKKFKI